MNFPTYLLSIGFVALLASTGALHAAPLVVTDVSPDTPYGASVGGDATGGRISTLAIDPTNNLILYGVSDAGVWKSTDGGRSWSEASVGLRNGIVPYFNRYSNSNELQAVDGNNSQRLLFASSQQDGTAPDQSGHYSYPYGGLYVSTDGAAHWRHAEFSAAAGATGGLCPTAQGNISTVAFSSGQPFVAAPCGLFTNTDPGLADGKWTQVVTPGSSSVVYLAPNAWGNALFLCPAGGNLVYGSTNLGLSWTPVSLAKGNTCWGLSVVPLGEFVPDRVAVIQQLPQKDPNNPVPPYWDVSLVDFQSQASTSLGFNAVAGRGGSGVPAIFTARRASAQLGDGRPGIAYDLYAADSCYFYVYVPGTNGMAWTQLSSKSPNGSSCENRGSSLHTDSWSMAFPFTYDPTKNVCTAYVSNDGGVFQNNSSVPAGMAGCDPSAGWVAAMSGLHTLLSGAVAGVSQTTPQTGCVSSSPCSTQYLPTGDNDVWAVTQGGAKSVLLDQSLGDAGGVSVDPAFPQQVVASRNNHLSMIVSSNTSPPGPNNPGQQSSVAPSTASAGLNGGNAFWTQLMALKGEAVSAPQYFVVESPAHGTSDIIVGASSNPLTSQSWVPIEAGAAKNFLGSVRWSS